MSRLTEFSVRTDIHKQLSLRCPLCSSCNWRIIGIKNYRKNVDIQTTYVAVRFKVLFELWHPNSENVEIKSVLCRDCGFVTYSPRPTEDDLESKYQFLGALPSTQTDVSCVQKRNDIKRSRELYRCLKPWLRGIGKEGKVLDYGGGKGALMAEFVSRGYLCHLIDYEASEQAGVERVGATLNDVRVGDRYDAVVLSHVLEHVADPKSLVSSLRESLKREGKMYIEVPMEIWGEAPLHEEPVTHINFFTTGSIRFMMEQAGLKVLYCRLGTHLHSNGTRKLVVRAIGTPGGGRRSGLRAGTAEVESLLNPTWGKKLLRYWLLPGSIPSAIEYKLQRLGRRH